MPLAAIIAVAAFALILAVIALMVWMGRYPDSRFAPLHASAAEAGDRSSDLAAEFFEWLRTGR